jgi:type II secretory pathway pseudopilin PulG
MRAEIAGLREHDQGFTLVELLVYMLLAVVVLTIVGGILINSLRVESQIRDATSAADATQLAAQSLGRGIRNASAIHVSQPDTDSILVRTRSIDSQDAGEWFCNAWYVGADGGLRWTTSPAAISPSPTSTEVDAWLLLVEGVGPSGAGPLFSLDADERSLSVAFSVKNGDGSPILLSTTMVSRQPIPTTGKVTEPCF